MIGALSFYKGKKVFITGHNGFKGAWMCKMLTDLGADVCGLSMPRPPGGTFSVMGLDERVTSVDGLITDTDAVRNAILGYGPDVIIHMAAQPLVRLSYEDPVGTYMTNVMGTVNTLDAARKCDTVLSFVNVTTDKVYRNTERLEGYTENETIDGYDPYSNSKSCSELVTWTYKRSFFDRLGVPVSTCRAGNVIGGGDMAKDRIIPDCVRSAVRGEPIILRNPLSVRPYQHVLEPVFAYLLLAAKQAEDHTLAGSYNIGPDDESAVTTQRLAELFCMNWKGAEWKIAEDADAPHEANLLRLDCSKFKRTFNWSPKWNISEAVGRTADWYMAEHKGKDMEKFTSSQIRDFL
ncbi:MAG: CDP-glucose 4,6-dehydratase [Methanomassiliicoccaceae archaeon]|nr:CDP-glucose 4,6-dehydratase [Methanomassiliicoccaceae archaeon]